MTEAALNQQNVRSTLQPCQFLVPFILVAWCQLLSQ